MSVPGCVTFKWDGRAGCAVAEVTLDDGERLEIELGFGDLDELWLSVLETAANSCEAAVEFRARYSQLRRRLSSRARAFMVDFERADFDRGR